MIRPFLRSMPCLLVLCGGCMGLVPAEGTVSYGLTNDGILQGGVALEDQGVGFVRGRPGDDTRWGTAELVSALKRAVASVDGAFPGTEPLRIGDLSSPSGGRHSRHGSHRSGRDADLIFYATDLFGRPAPGVGFLAYDRFGLARDPRAPGGLYRFDDARNWHLVRTLLLDEEARVQWIFCSNGVKSRLLRHAARVERSPELLVRAAWVLHEPSRARRHDDHFHVRVLCSPEQRVSGCRDQGPIWPWLRKEAEQSPSDVDPSHSDAILVRALLDDLPSDAVALAPGGRGS